MSARAILIIDDHVDLARGFAEVLTRAGYTVHTAFSADKGLALATTEVPDAIILDIGMPFVNGIGLLYRLRALPALASTPVLVVTGIVVTAEMRADLSDLGAVVRSKPISMSELIAAVHHLFADQAPPPDDPRR